MSHMKRESVPKTWPVTRKGTAYLVRPASGEIPLLVILRDMLDVSQTRKEAKKAIQEKLVLLNNRFARDEKEGLNLFDTLSIIPAKKSYRLELTERGKYALVEIKESEANNKIAKVTNKKTLKGKKTQLNLSDGRNFISNIKCRINDSVLINFKDKKIEKCIPLNEKSRAIVIVGKHMGKKGIIEKIIPERKMVSLKIEDNKVDILIKQIMVLE